MLSGNISEPNFSIRGAATADQRKIEADAPLVPVFRAAFRDSGFQIFRGPETHDLSGFHECEIAGSRIAALTFLFLDDDKFSEIAQSDVFTSDQGLRNLLEHLIHQRGGLTLRDPVTGEKQRSREIASGDRVFFAVEFFMFEGLLEVLALPQLFFQHDERLDWDGASETLKHIAKLEINGQVTVMSRLREPSIPARGLFHGESRNALSDPPAS